MLWRKPNRISAGRRWRVEAEGRARGHHCQRLADFVTGWFRNPKCGTGRRSKKYRKYSEYSQRPY